MTSQLNSSRSTLQASLGMLLAVALSFGCAPAVLAGNESPYSVPQASAAATENLPAGARKLASKLQLTAEQRVELARILASQREQIRKLWSDPELEPAYRVRAMRLINDQTEDRIRGMLTDEQKKKYLMPHPSSTTPSSQSQALEHWFDAPSPK